MPAPWKSNTAKGKDPKGKKKGFGVHGNSKAGKKSAKTKDPNYHRPEKNDTVVVFNETDRRQFLQGFHSRKTARRKSVIAALVQKERREKIQARGNKKDETLRAHGLTREDVLAKVDKAMQSLRHVNEVEVESSTLENDAAVVHTTISAFELDDAARSAGFEHEAGGNQDSDEESGSGSSDEEHSQVPVASGWGARRGKAPELTASELRKAMQRAKRQKQVKKPMRMKGAVKKRDKAKLKRAGNIRQAGNAKKLIGASGKRPRV